MFHLRTKPGGWFLLAKYLKNTCGRVIFYVKMQVDDQVQTDKLGGWTNYHVSTDKPGSCFLLVKCLKNTCESVTF